MIETEIKGIPLKFSTNDQVFSPTAIDQGTLAMLAQVDFQPNDKVLDLGCGYGVVGILAARLIGSPNVVLCDLSEAAVALAKINAELNGCGQLRIIKSDGLNQIEDHDFTLILSNPPYHVDFSVPRSFIEQGYRKLAIGGKLYMVTKRKDWYKNKLISTFGGVQITESNGYYVFCAEKRAARKIEKANPVKLANLSKKLQRKQSRQERPKD